MKKIEYSSTNGYRGVLYGESSMIVFDPDGKEVFHTGRRTPNTLDELKEIVEDMPEFMEKLRAMMMKRHTVK